MPTPRTLKDIPYWARADLLWLRAEFLLVIGMYRWDPYPYDEILLVAFIILNHVADAKLRDVALWPSALRSHLLWLTPNAAVLLAVALHSMKMTDASGIAWSNVHRGLGAWAALTMLLLLIRLAAVSACWLGLWTWDKPDHGPARGPRNE